jgi:hypothetical protein
MKKESPLLSIGINIVVPVLILTKLSSDQYLGPVNSMLLALAFPLGYGIYDFTRSRKMNFIALLGFLSVLLTGAFSLFELDPLWIAVKEAAVPGIIGIVVVASIYFGQPLIKKLLLNEQLFELDKMYAKLRENGAEEKFENSLKMRSYWLGGSFFLSALLNFVLARLIVSSPAGTAEYNAEIGKMTALSFPVIALPCTLLMLWLLWLIFKDIRKLTGLELDDLMASQSK